MPTNFIPFLLLNRMCQQKRIHAWHLSNNRWNFKSETISNKLLPSSWHESNVSWSIVEDSFVLFKRYKLINDKKLAEKSFFLSLFSIIRALLRRNHMDFLSFFIISAFFDTSHHPTVIFLLVYRHLWLLVSSLTLAFSRISALFWVPKQGAFVLTSAKFVMGTTSTHKKSDKKSLALYWHQSLENTSIP